MSGGLREVAAAAPDIDADGVRRWFTSECMDLFVWARDGEISAFELCYGKPHDERSVRWSRTHELRHARIDDGEASPWRNDAPLAVADGRVDPVAIALDFEREAAALDPPLYRTILRLLYRI